MRIADREGGVNRGPFDQYSEELDQVVTAETRSPQNVRGGGERSQVTANG